MIHKLIIQVIQAIHAILLMTKPLVLALLALLVFLPSAYAEDRPYIKDWLHEEKEEERSLGNLPPEFFEADMPTIMEKMIKAYGGHAAILASERMLAKGRVFDIADEKYYTYMHYMATGDRFRKDKVVAGRSEVWILNGWHSFVGVEGMARFKLKGLALKELRLERIFLALPLMLSRSICKVSYLGTASSGGRLVYSMMIEISEGEGEQINVIGMDLDVKSGLIVKVTARVEDKGETMPLEFQFSSYESVNETKLPKKIAILRDEVLIEQIEVFKYTPNPVMSNFLFE